MKVLRSIALALLLVVCSGTTVHAARPDLIVVIALDQFPQEYLQRFQPYFGPGGFNRFLDHGAAYQNCYFSHATTFTGPGHAAIGTGLTPAENGIIANTWFDRETGQAEYCVEDGRVELSEGGSTKVSPVNLAEDSLGDRLQEKYPGSRVYSVSIKDRAAILMAGKKATAAYWFDYRLPGFVSTDYYKFNRSLLEFNKSIPPFVASFPSWIQSEYIPEADLAKITFDPPELRKYKTDRAGFGVSFPHPIKDANALTYTPYGNDLVLNFAEKLIITEKIGTEDGSPDLLYVGLSSPDYLGHLFGPDSLEVADMVVRTDLSLTAFINGLERRFDRRVTIAITADHGVQSIPEIAVARGKDAGRVDIRDPKKEAKTFADLSPGRRDLENRIAKRLKYKVTDSTPLSAAAVLFFDEPALYMNWDGLRARKLEPERVKQAAKAAVLEIKGLNKAYTSTELLMPNKAASELELSVRNAFRADRSGDVIMTLKEGYIWGYGLTGANHGQPVEMDTHVPLLFWGNSIKPGDYPEKVSVTDLATTLGSIVGVSAGRKDAKPLSCVVITP